MNERTVTSSFFAFIFAASPVLAANDVVIDQVVGNNKVSIQQLGEGNSARVEMKQIPSNAKEIKPKAVSESNIKAATERKQKDAGLQDNALSYSERARAQRIIDQQTGNSIRVYQQGANNTVKAHQEGDSNALDVEQSGAKNSVNRKQQGKKNTYKIIQNDIVTDENGYSEGEKK